MGLAARAYLVAVAVAIVATAGCSSEQKATGLVVVVDTDYDVPDELSFVRVRVQNASGIESASQDFDLGTSLMVPFSFGVAPRPGQVDRPVTIFVEGYVSRGGQMLVSRRAETGFIKGQLRLLQMFLARRCETEAASCMDDETCTEDGCASASRPPSTLPTVRPGNEIPDSGPTDTGMDGGVDSGPGPDTGTDVGPPDTAAVDAPSMDAPSMDAPSSDAAADAFADVPGLDASFDTGPDAPICSPSCDDMNPCTDDTCMAGNVCLHTTRDADGDGHGDINCPGVGGVPADDCNDTRSDVAPGMPDDCNGLDDNCNNIVDEGWPCVRGTTVDCTTSCNSTGSQLCGTDCTLGAACNPPAEVCGNGVDDDCDGVADEVDAGCMAGCGGCPGSINVTVPGGRFTEMTGTDGHRGTCAAGADGPEALFTFTLTTASDVFLTTHHMVGTDTVLYVRECQCDGTEVACNDDADGHTTSALRLPGLAAGTYNVFVDTKVTMSIDATLDLYVTVPGEETERCGNPGAIAAGATSLSGNTCGKLDDYDAVTVAGCTDPVGDGADQVYYFVSPGGPVTFDGCTSGSQYDSAIFVRNTCIDPPAPANPATNQVACNDDGADCGNRPSCDGFVRSEISSPNLAPGLYYLVVDAYQDQTACNCGPYQFDLSGL